MAQGVKALATDADQSSSPSTTSRGEFPSTVFWLTHVLLQENKNF